MVGGTPAGHRRRRRHRLVERDFTRLPVNDGRNGTQGHAATGPGRGPIVGVGPLGRFERRGAYASRPMVSGFPRPVRRVGAPAPARRREACIVHGFRPVSLRDQQLAVRPVGCRTGPPAEYDRWLDEHWDDPPDAKAVQYRRNAIVDPKRLPDRWIQACLWTITPHDVADIRPACGKPDTIGDHG